MGRLLTALALALLTLAWLPRAHAAPPSERSLGVVILDERGNPLEARLPDRPFPAASAIKVAILIEFLDAHAEHLDAPTPSVARALADARHPAMAPFPPQRRPELVRAMTSATARQLGVLMIDGLDARGRRVDNLTYNAASNAAIAALGGPEALTARLQRRAPELAGLVIRRYMLAARAPQRDNTATPRALATLHHMIASGSLPDVAPDALQAARDILATDPPRPGVRLAAKDGALVTAPLAVALAGSFARGDQRRSYALLTEAPRAGTPPPRQQLQALKDHARAQLQRLLEPWLAASPGPSAPNEKQQ